MKFWFCSILLYILFSLSFGPIQKMSNDVVAPAETLLFTNSHSGDSDNNKDEFPKEEREDKKEDSEEEKDKNQNFNSLSNTLLDFTIIESPLLIHNSILTSYHVGKDPYWSIPRYILFSRLKVDC